MEAFSVQKELGLVFLWFDPENGIGVPFPSLLGCSPELWGAVPFLKASLRGSRYLLFVFKGSRQVTSMFGASEKRHTLGGGSWGEVVGEWTKPTLAN